MALMERVTTLLRANVNDLIDRAEEPEKMLKQLVLDLENQLLQVKTQVAIAIADQHLLERKKAEHDAAVVSWKSKAAMAVSRGRDEMAREALGRLVSHTQMAESFAEQIEDQRTESEALRGSFLKLQQKLLEVRTRCELMIAEHRRTRGGGRARKAEAAASTAKSKGALERYGAQIAVQAAANGAVTQVMAETESLEDRFAMLERDQQVEALLEELKSQKALTA